MYNILLFNIVWLKPIDGYTSCLEDNNINYFKDSLVLNVLATCTYF